MPKPPNKPPPVCEWELLESDLRGDYIHLKCDGVSVVIVRVYGVDFSKFGLRKE